MKAEQSIIMITLDGSQGEGGGQILRSALALSLVTGRPFRIHQIRARRPKPGLMRQHLACVEAAARIGNATVEGATPGSRELVFHPGTMSHGNHTFTIDGAGSTMLLLQTVLMPLLLAGGPSELVLEGGTHNPFAPPHPFIEASFLPLLRRMGFRVDTALEHPGFYPRGGGRCLVRIDPVVGGVASLCRMDLPARTVKPALSAIICAAGVPRAVVEQESAELRRRLELGPDQIEVRTESDAFGPGNTVHVVAALDGYAEVFTGFGGRGKRAGEVVGEAVAEAQLFMQSQAATGPHLADQLLLPMALAKGGSQVTVEPSDHTRTNIAVIGQFLDAKMNLKPEHGLWTCEVSGAPQPAK
jgi:RNA 3'-terminal phosphate cyclase (ATP)